MANSVSAADRRYRRRLLLRQVDWPVAIGISLMHVGAIFAVFYFSWSAFFVSCFLAWSVDDPIAYIQRARSLMNQRGANPATE